MRINEDNNIDVQFLDGNGDVLGQKTGLTIPDGTQPLQVSSSGVVAAGSVIEGVRFIGHESGGAATNYVTLMEIRAGVFSGAPATTIAETTDTSTITGTMEVNFNDVDLADVGHTTTNTAASTSGTTTGLTLNEAALINLVTVSSTTKTTGSTRGSAALGFSATSTAFDYLAAGESVTVTYTAQVDDLDGGADTGTFEAIITGTNDGPTVTAATDVSGGVTEITDLAAGENSSNVTDSGSFTIADVDLTNVQTVGLTGTPTTTRDGGMGALLGTLTPTIGDNTTNDGAGRIDWTFSVADAAIGFLQAGETITQIYTVTFAKMRR